MKKILLIFLICVLRFSFSSAQDTLACRNGKKIVGKVISVGKLKVTYIVPPDSTPRSISSWRMDYIAYPGGTKFNFTDQQRHEKPSSPSEFYISADYGYSVPVATYKDAIVGPHGDLSATLYFNEHIGIMVKVGSDFNSTVYSYLSNNYWGGYYVFQQYLAGLSYKIGGKPGFPWIDFIALGGICNVSNPTYEQGGGYNGLVVNTPGNGSGFAYYAGISFRSSADHFCSITFGLGCLGTMFTYPNYTRSYTNYDPYTNVTSNSISKQTTKMNLELLQMYLGIDLRMKRAGK